MTEMGWWNWLPHTGQMLACQSTDYGSTEYYLSLFIIIVIDTHTKGTINWARVQCSAPPFTSNHTVVEVSTWSTLSFSVFLDSPSFYESYHILNRRVCICMACCINHFSVGGPLAVVQAAPWSWALLFEVTSLGPSLGKGWIDIFMPPHVRTFLAAAHCRYFMLYLNHLIP